MNNMDKLKEFEWLSKVETEIFGCPTDVYTVKILTASNNTKLVSVNVARVKNAKDKAIASCTKNDNCKKVLAIRHGFTTDMNDKFFVEV